MTLSKDDAELFYGLWFPLLDFADQKLKIVPEIGKICHAKKLDLMLVKKIANVIRDNVQLID